MIVALTSLALEDAWTPPAAMLGARDRPRHRHVRLLVPLGGGRPGQPVVQSCSWDACLAAGRSLWVTLPDRMIVTGTFLAGVGEGRSHGGYRPSSRTPRAHWGAAGDRHQRQGRAAATIALPLLAGPAVELRPAGRLGALGAGHGRPPSCSSWRD